MGRMKYGYVRRAARTGRIISTTSGRDKLCLMAESKIPHCDSHSNVEMRPRSVTAKNVTTGEITTVIELWSCSIDGCARRFWSAFGYFEGADVNSGLRNLTCPYHGDFMMVSAQGESGGVCFQCPQSNCHSTALWPKVGPPLQFEFRSPSV